LLLDSDQIRYAEAFSAEFHSQPLLDSGGTSFVQFF
jgi:hypothetical protein